MFLLCNEKNLNYLVENKLFHDMIFCYKERSFLVFKFDCSFNQLSAFTKYSHLFAKQKSFY